ncbi:MAG: hypothetical protein GY702_04910 [Desulfobulbaceae bacterium]|nr:hypothetical protein [Desulfobulbaceae bacterium]
MSNSFGGISHKKVDTADLKVHIIWIPKYRKKVFQGRWR